MATIEATIEAPVRIEPELLTAEQSWTLCGLSKSAWYKAKAKGAIPRPVRIGGALRWRRGELRKWFDAGCPPLAKWEQMAARKK